MLACASAADPFKQHQVKSRGPGLRTLKEESLELDLLTSVVSPMIPPTARTSTRRGSGSGFADKHGGSDDSVGFCGIAACDCQLVIANAECECGQRMRNASCGLQLPSGESKCARSLGAHPTKTIEWTRPTTLSLSTVRERDGTLNREAPVSRTQNSRLPRGTNFQSTGIGNGGSQGCHPMTIMGETQRK